MKVLYDYQALTQRIGGASRYHVELIRHLRHLGVDCEVPFLFSDNVYLDEVNIKHSFPLKGWNCRIKNDIFKFLNQIIDVKYIKSGDFDILHPTQFNPYFIKHTKKTVVITMHDLNHAKFPDMVVKSDVVIRKEKEVCNRANAIIAISEETKLDMMNYLNVPEEKITVVHHGMNQEIYKSDAPRLFQRDYILYIGGRRGYKNFKAFLKGFSCLNTKIDLVCTGHPYNMEEIELINKLGIADRVYQQFVSDDGLYNLLSNATFFVYPSLGEGFGLPILEAFRCSCPCVISDIMCFHEVAGKAALYFNPNDPDSMRDIMEKALSDTRELDMLRTRGLEQLKIFTWERTAKKTMDLYNKMI